MTAEQLTDRAFWVEHPLTWLYAIAHGQWIDGAFVPCSSWSKRELRSFAEQLPAKVIDNLAGGTIAP